MKVKDLGCRRAAGSVIKASKQVADSAREKAVTLSNLSQGALASALSVDLNSAMASLAKGPETIYDKAMDAKYLATSIGGGNHRLFDGGHTLSGALQAAHGASPNDSIVEVAFGYMQSLFRDVTTPKGLPLANWDKPTYDQASAFMKSEFGIPKSWFYDLNSFDAAEVLGSAISVLAVTLMWSRADAEQFSRLAGGMGLAAALSANPLLLIVTVVCLAKAFSEARSNGRLGDVADGLARGTATAVTALGAVALTSMAGGPPGLALLVGLVAGLVVGELVSNISVSDVARVVAGQLQTTAKSGVDQAKASVASAARTTTKMFNREKFTQAASVINECVIPFTAREQAERLRHRFPSLERWR